MAELQKRQKAVISANVVLRVQELCYLVTAFIEATYISNAQ